jgi:hypothetical protein
MSVPPLQRHPSISHAAAQYQYVGGVQGRETHTHVEADVEDLADPAASGDAQVSRAEADQVSDVLVRDVDTLGGSRRSCIGSDMKGRRAALQQTTYQRCR